MALVSSGVIQKGAKAGGDIIGRDKVEVHVHSAPTSVIGHLLAKLQKEVEENEKVRQTIEALARFRTPRETDGVVGLKAKLDAGGAVSGVSCRP